MIELKNVSKKYRNGTHALNDVSLKVNDGEFIYIMGPTGSGKSTLIKLLDGEEVPTSGSVLVSGINVGRLKKSKVYLYRRKIGVVFQDYRLLPEKTVFENVAYALEILDMPDDKIRKRVREVLKLVDLADKSNAKPNELSGGQQQRTAIARAIAKKPTIMIADEPTGNLDSGMTDEMISLLEKINREEKTTLVVVTHDDMMVMKHPKRTIRIEAGHVVADKTPEPRETETAVEHVEVAEEPVVMEMMEEEPSIPEAAKQEPAAVEVTETPAEGLSEGEVS
ncbi:MAG: ATP-binding cassette domain-containing protein [Erysipelotrichaceae bacterium]|nr:ATP-binding cassette domain-containing protein [Erysipelotrichaceae bacterium]